MASPMPVSIMEEDDFRNVGAQLRAALLEALDVGFTEVDIFRMVVEALRETGCESTPGLYVRPTQRSSRGH